MVYRTLLRWMTIVSTIVTLASSRQYAQDELATEIIDEPTEGEGIEDLTSTLLSFVDELYPMERNIGRSATLSCKVTGLPPLNLYIFHDRIASYKAKQKKRMLSFETVYDSSKPNELGVVYKMESLREKHAGIYKCQAESIDGQIALSTMELTLQDPCEGVVCGFREECVNVRGAGICTCDFECFDNSPVCANGLTYGSLCHMQRAECRAGKRFDDHEEGSCPDSQALSSTTEASCSISGEGHVTKFNGDFYTFRGSCPYKMVEDTRGGVLIVYARTETCGETASGNCLRSVTMYVDRIYGFSIERGWLINDNGRSRNVLNGERLLLGGGAVSITRVGKTLVGKVENKQIEFFYDGLNYFKLTVPLDYVSKHNDFAGFCGHIPVDHVPTSGRDISFLDNIIMPALGSEDVCRATIGNPECKNSELATEVRNTFVNNQGLAACAKVIPMEIYIERAVQDTCNCDLAGDTNYCFCNILYSYVEDCRQADIKIAFAGTHCAKSFHKDVFKSEGVSYNRRRWFYNRRSL